jgi:hypothetical protein
MLHDATSGRGVVDISRNGWRYAIVHVARVERDEPGEARPDDEGVGATCHASNAHRSSNRRISSSLKRAGGTAIAVANCGVAVGSAVLILALTAPRSLALIRPSPLTSAKME